MNVVVSQEFIDFDGQTVKSGTYENAKIERMGYSLDRRNWFWNITQNGTATLREVIRNDGNSGTKFYPGDKITIEF